MVVENCVARTENIELFIKMFSYFKFMYRQMAVQTPCDNGIIIMNKCKSSQHITIIWETQTFIVVKK